MAMEKQRKDLIALEIVTKQVEAKDHTQDEAEYHTGKADICWFSWPMMHLQYYEKYNHY